MGKHDANELRGDDAVTRKNNLFTAIFAGIVAAVTGCDNAPSVSFKNDVDPILNKYCAECHTAQGEGTRESGYEVDSYEAVMMGTKYGPVIVAGDSTSSTLYRLVAGEVDKSIQMPHGKNKLSAEEIAVIKNWIDQGAKNN
jgi:hypothetical protein